MEQDLQQTNNLEERANQLENLHKSIEKEDKEKSKELQATKDQLFKASSTLFELREKEADIIAEISGAQGSSRNLSQKIHELDTSALAQQEMLYKIEFQVQSLERKVSFASGKRSYEETVDLQQQIEQLTQQVDSLKSQENMLTQQCKKVEEELRAAKKESDKIFSELKSLQSQEQQLQTILSSDRQQINFQERNHQEQLMAHDSLLLQVQRLQANLGLRADKLSSLEHRRNQILIAFKEREQELDSRTAISRATQKVNEEERNKLACETQKCHLKLEKLKKKFESTSIKTDTQEERETGVKQSLAHHMIAIAQEREELQRQGDALNQQIK